jgi:hypothetical protein
LRFVLNAVNGILPKTPEGAGCKRRGLGEEPNTPANDIHDHTSTFFHVVLPVLHTLAPDSLPAKFSLAPIIYASALLVDARNCSAHSSRRDLCGRHNGNGLTLELYSIYRRSSVYNTMKLHARFGSPWLSDAEKLLGCLASLICDDQFGVVVRALSVE